MLYTYKVRSVDTIQNSTNIVDALYNGTVIAEPTQLRTNRAYNDFSYDRYKTTEILPARFMLASPHINSDKQTLKQLTSITTRMQLFLMDYPSPSEMYSTFKIPKRSGGMRTINAPNIPLMRFMRELQPWFAYKLNCLPHDSAYAYVHGRDCNKSIQRHQAVKSNWFLKLDIKKFFDNCDADFIRGQLKLLYPFALMEDYNYEEFIVSLIKLITKDNGLPQGTPLSPVITNLLMVPIDKDINKYLNNYFKEHNQSFMYTRYADDMLISSNKEIDVTAVTEIIDRVLHTYTNKLEINKDKTRYGSKSGSNWNLGIMYNKENNLTVGYKRKKKIKTMLFQFHLCYNNGTRDKEYAQVLLGELAYLNNIEPLYTKELIAFMNRKYSTDFYDILHRTVKEI